ncbi:MTH895/ArsE family thioredoxin-like protein [Sulfurovum lithotrophicum]|uniref:MTH895/ArsE family thioredoxin-like protein n=1 Tax=Sulfurovum lithotrophicum TaxID=206403 RepID=UPI000A019DDA
MSTNRIVRIVVGLGLIGYGIYAQNWWFALGIIPLITGIVNWCPLEMKMGTCDPASGCCASTPAQNTSACCTPAAPTKVSSFSAAQPAKAEACCSDDDSCCDTATKIEVLGSGCKRCGELEAAAKEAVNGLEGDFEIAKVEDPQTIAAYRVMHTPGLVINGKVRSTGKVLKAEEIRALLESDNIIKEKTDAACCA